MVSAYSNDKETGLNLIALFKACNDRRKNTPTDTATDGRTHRLTVPCSYQNPLNMSTLTHLAIYDRPFPAVVPHPPSPRHAYTPRDVCFFLSLMCCHRSPLIFATRQNASYLFFSFPPLFLLSSLISAARQRVSPRSFFFFSFFICF